MPPSYETNWHLDKRVPIALIVTMLLQVAGVIWWASRTDARIANIEDALMARRGDGTDIAVLKNSVAAIKETVDRIYTKVDALEHK